MLVGIVDGVLAEELVVELLVLVSWMVRVSACFGMESSCRLLVFYCLCCCLRCPQGLLHPHSFFVHYEGPWCRR